MNSFSIVEEELVLVVEFKVEVEVLELLLFVETIVEDEEKELLLQPKRKKEIDIKNDSLFVIFLFIFPPWVIILQLFN